MGKLSWYVNRLKAMNLPEVCWRIRQKGLQREEAAFAKKCPIDVSSKLLYADLEKQLTAPLGKCVGPESLPLEGEPFVSVFGKKENASTNIRLLGGYDYEKYKNDWLAGFNTSNQWPLTQSYSLAYKQCDAIGDARLNWELNRCYQFGLLARKGDVAALGTLLRSWCAANPWLMGISWTSVMEVAIRAVQWTVAAYYLSLLPEAEQTLDVKRRLECGALNMCAYVSQHYSRYSSANNHLLVEALCILFVGTAFDMHDWSKLGLRLLDEELDRQNYPDGVNKEMALHYQTFAMEAYALAVIVSKDLKGQMPGRWRNILSNACEFVEWSIANGKPMEWGDNDEGKILDLRGGNGHGDHYRYVLKLYEWLGIQAKIKDDTLVKQFIDGGYTFARSTDHKVLLGIDHAPLGFGTIAAHGHADALSLQLDYDALRVFTDPGTFVYHCNLPMRDDLRRTINHNTICIDGHNQSEMLGAFLWGKRAEPKVLETDLDESTGHLHLVASHDGYSPVIHTRTLDFDGQRAIRVYDQLSEKSDFALTYVLGEQIRPVIIDENIVDLSVDDKVVARLHFDCNDARVSIEDIMISPEFGVLSRSKAVRVRGRGDKIVTDISLMSF